jgi:hypothetical protein
VRVAGPVKGPRSAAAAAVLVLLVVSAAAPARAHTRVFIGGVLGFPAPYPYPRYYAYPVPYPAGVDPAVLPPGWAPGHWEWRYDRWGRPYQAWIPPHLE